jgi:hypothetical protein
MARRKNVKRIDPRYFLNETVNRLDEREGETAEDVAVRLKNIPVTMRAGAVNDFLNMRDGSTEMARHYPHVQDLVAFASDVLELLGLNEEKKDEEGYERPLEAGLAEEKDDDWIQDAEADIERRGTEGVCTGEKFGSDSCPPGSKRYNLAKTFRKMAKKRKKD